MCGDYSLELKKKLMPISTEEVMCYNLFGIVNLFDSVLNFTLYKSTLKSIDFPQKENFVSVRWNLCNKSVSQ